MSTLNDLTAKLGGKDGQDGGLATLQQMISSHGGLQGLTSKLTSSGLGKQVQSWIGTGDNQPVTGPQVQQAMNPNTLNSMAKQAGMTPEETSEKVAQALPQMVDHATPQGKIPEQDPFSKGLDSIKQLLHM